MTGTYDGGGTGVAADHDAEFAEFAAASLADLRRTAYLMCGDWHRAEDAAQEALIRVYRSWHRVRSREALLGYARRACVRVVIDESRRPWRRESPSDEAGRDLAVAGPGDLVADRDAMVEALAGLTPRRRACLVLRFYHDLSVAESARVLRCSEGTVKSQTHAALRQLQPLLAAHEDAGSAVREGRT
ncbi:SigE family RNA polymerase sigma factor [Nocardioides sp. GXQ0305]|uniref:SigE family RNA polymerase sigma factor n=1 Tax=Nocardioides sp. GXQ0305 TaxID=3423912 RepID=UPI003D7CA520